MTYGVKLLVLLVFLAIRKLFIDRFRTLELFETVLFGKVCTRLRIFCVCQSRWILTEISILLVRPVQVNRETGVNH